MVQEVDSRNLTKVITQKLSITSGVIGEFLLSKLICFGVEMWFFLGCQDYSYATNSNYAIDMQNIHCMPHQSNLVIQVICKLNMVYNSENIVQTLYAYFNKSPKRHLEFIKLVEIMEIQDNKSLKKSKQGGFLC